MRLITKEAVENILREYIELQLSPNEQPEPRPSEYFDIKGITDEIFEWLKRLPSRTTIAEYKKIERQIIRRAELLADRDRVFKVNAIHVSFAAEDIFSTFQKF